jgi:hypothetical protein
MELYANRAASAPAPQRRRSKLLPVPVFPGSIAP